MNGNGGIPANNTEAIGTQGAGTVPGTLDYYAAHGEWYPEGYTGTINPSTQYAAASQGTPHLALLAVVVLYMVMK